MLEGLQAFLSVAATLTLWFGQRLFDEAKDAASEVERCLNDLASRQERSIMRLIDDEVIIAQEIQRLGVEEAPRSEGGDRARTESVGKLLDGLWEDALAARQFEMAHKKWCHLERQGAFTCRVGTVVNLGALMIVAVTWGRIEIAWWQYISIMVFTVGIPWVIVVVLLVFLTPLRRFVARTLQAPGYGIPRQRRFGGE